MKILSIIVPSYNVEKYLHRCLDSLCYDENTRKYLDIIVVDDGSTDKTKEIAIAYSKKYGCISVISKKNGGHGSAINAGFRKAKGKYVKIIDADDWVNVWDFDKFVATLNNETVDLVITSYRRDVLYNETSEPFFFLDNFGSEHDIREIKSDIEKEDFFFKYSMHSICVRREALKKVWGKGLMENCFYVDQQFVAKVLDCADKYKVLDFDIYRYFIGRPEQSVNNYAKHIDNHAKVLFWLMRRSKKTAAEAKKDYLNQVLRAQISLMLKTHLKTMNKKYGLWERRRQKVNFFRKIKKTDGSFTRRRKNVI